MAIAPKIRWSRDPVTVFWLAVLPLPHGLSQ